MLNDPNPNPAAQQRENPEPSERMQPIPLTVAALTLAMVLFGAAYLFRSESFGLSGYGDRRSAAELSGTAPAAVNEAGQADGKVLFASHCVACHQATGKGLPGVFPPLDGSEWVRGDERVVANILLHGIKGPIEVAGATYNGEMPPFAQLSDAELAAIVTYVRAQWSNTAPAVAATRFTEERKTVQRSAPFAGGAELKALATGGK
jgi:mono/diheme cytochrome c family protein